ncbi:MAG: hypothetical protein ACLPKT_16055 [Methylocella sp.]
MTGSAAAYEASAPNPAPWLPAPSTGEQNYARRASQLSGSSPPRPKGTCAMKWGVAAPHTVMLGAY